MADILNLKGWQFMFLMEGMLAVLLGSATLFYLVDKPENDRRWLAHSERAWLLGQLDEASGSTIRPLPDSAAAFFSARAHSWRTPMWHSHCCAPAAAAADLAAINDFARIGGFIGPSLVGWMKGATDRFAIAPLVLAIFPLISFVTTMTLKVHRT